MSYLTHDDAALAEAAQAAVDRARRAGAEAAAVTEIGGGAVLSVSEGEIDTASRDGHQMLTLTVYRDGRSARASSASLDREAVARTVDEALTIARMLQPDPDASLADPAWLALDGPEVALFAPDDRGPSALLDAALAIDAAASGEGRRVTSAGAASTDGALALATSAGFCRTSRYSYQSRWCSVLVQDSDVAVQDGAQSEDRRLPNLDPVEKIAALAVGRALAGCGARAIDSRRCPILFEPRAAAMLVGDLVGALSGAPQYMKQSFFPDPIGKRLLADHLDLEEDPFEPFGLASAAFDGEGVAGIRRKIVEQGVVRGLFLSCRSARRLGLRSTGNANGPYNLRFTSREPGGDWNHMLSRLGTGLVVTHFLGGATDPVSGGWTRAIAGFWVENGTVAHPVRDLTLAGTMPEMLRNIITVGADEERMGAFRTGSILIDEMQVGGVA